MLHIRSGLILLVIAAVFLSQSGLIAWSNIKQLSSHYVSEHQKTISTRDTITLSLSAMSNKHTIIWLEKDEVRYLGNMFDVRLILKSAHHVKLIGHYDRLDDELFNLLSNLLEKDKKNNPDNKNIFQFNFPDIILNNSPSFIVFFENTESIIVCSIIHMLYASCNTDDDIKPPEYRC